MSHPDSTETVPWWRRAVVYQVYVRSFADGNGDGIGDLRGLTARLPHIAELGADAIWLNPWYPSPLLDGGYDVADFRDIDPRIGSLAEAEQFIAAAHGHGIKVITDLVPNHTSWDHVWFRAAREAEPGSPERSRYVFRDGRGPDGSEPPNNWQSVFGGPAWTRVDDGQWYLHLFDSSQPDLDWNHPEVAEEFLDVMRFWLDRGVDGFRIDVAHGMMKAPGLPDLAGDQSFDNAGDHGTHPYWDRDDIHPIIRTWRELLDTYDGDRMMVAEAWVSPTRLPLYLRPDEYQQSFNFTFLRDSWRGHLHNQHIPQMAGDVAALGSSMTWCWNNHDVVRNVTRFGLPEQGDWTARLWLHEGPHDWLDDAQGRRRARAGALLQLALPGSAYVYMGDELGLPEYWDMPDEARQDPDFHNSERKGRDGCRVPLPWAADEPHLGFGGQPWLPQPDVYRELAVDRQVDDADSFLTFYRRAIALRREHGMADEDLTMLDLGRDVVAFRRGSGLTCVVNMGTQPVDLPAGDLVLASGDEPADGRLAPDDAVWLLAPDA